MDRLSRPSPEFLSIGSLSQMPATAEAGQVEASNRELSPDLLCQWQGNNDCICLYGARYQEARLESRAETKTLTLLYGIQASQVVC